MHIIILQNCIYFTNFRYFVHNYQISKLLYRNLYKDIKSELDFKKKFNYYTTLKEIKKLLVDINNDSKLDELRNMNDKYYSISDLYNFCDTYVSNAEMTNQNIKKQKKWFLEQEQINIIADDFNKIISLVNANDLEMEKEEEGTKIVKKENEFDKKLWKTIASLMNFKYWFFYKIIPQENIIEKEIKNKLDESNNAKAIINNLEK